MTERWLLDDLDTSELLIGAYACQLCGKAMLKKIKPASRFCINWRV